jgi:hypothetical protein
MKIRLPGALVGLAISFALPTYAQQKDVADSQIVQKVIDSFKGWEEAVLKGDAATVASYYADDAVFVTPEGPIIGREECRLPLLEAVGIPFLHRPV